LGIHLGAGIVSSIIVATIGAIILLVIRGIANGWLHYASTTAPGSIWIAGCSAHGPWLLSVAHSGVATELGTTPAFSFAGPGIATFVLVTIKELHAALDRVYKQAMSLPDTGLVTDFDILIRPP
jgi:hypothetical protein